MSICHSVSSSSIIICISLSSCVIEPPTNYYQSYPLIPHSAVRVFAMSTSGVSLYLCQLAVTSINHSCQVSVSLVVCQSQPPSVGDTWHLSMTAVICHLPYAAGTFEAHVVSPPLMSSVSHRCHLSVVCVIWHSYL